MTAARTVTATFTALPEQTLIVGKSGTGTGKVTSDPAGIDCGATCNADFPHSSTVTLTADPDPGSEFTGWSGEGCSGTGTCQVTMTEARAVSATFDAMPDQTLTISKTGLGSGTVTSGPAGINCGDHLHRELPVRHRGQPLARTRLRVRLQPLGGRRLQRQSGVFGHHDRCALRDRHIRVDTQPPSRRSGRTAPAPAPSRRTPQGSPAARRARRTSLRAPPLSSRPWPMRARCSTAVVDEPNEECSGGPTCRVTIPPLFATTVGATFVSCTVVEESRTVSGTETIESCGTLALVSTPGGRRDGQSDRPRGDEGDAA